METTQAISMKGKVEDLNNKLLKLFTHWKKEADAKAEMVKTKTATLVKNPNFQTVCISTSAGAVVLGSAGGAFGCASGIVLGGTAGVVPALLTFGLSIPTFAAVGGGMGLCSGVVIGGSTGAIGGAVAGHTGYKHRVQIKDGIVFIQTTTVKKAKETQIQITGVVNGTMIKVKSLGSKSKAEAMKLAKITQEKVGTIMEKPIALAREPKVQMTTAGVAAGTVAGGTVGGGGGVLIGAAVGVVPALFTFGLSIPVGAAIGGGIGLVTGGSVGAVGGGAVGFAGYTYKKEIGESKDKVSDYLNTKAKELGESKEKACGFLSTKVKNLKDRMSSTGGTA